MPAPTVSCVRQITGTVEARAMTNGDTEHAQALRPVETEPGVLVHSNADRRLATEHWLLSTHPTPRQARTEWANDGIALLPLGTLFSAVRIPARLVIALADSPEPADADLLLGEALDSGPVICDPRGLRYYALVPASMPVTWRQAADDWRPLDVEVLGRDTYLGVPRVDAVEPDVRTTASYWSVPMSSAAELCSPEAVAQLVVLARFRTAEEGAE
jgi:hypothetical protein